MEPCGELYACHRISSFEKKPANPGIPAIATEPTHIVQWVIGILSFSPPMLRMSCSPPIAWMTDPEQRKSRALKKAWVNRWNTATQYAPTPSARNMYPSWLTVEYASTRLISVCTSAIEAARIAVNAPMAATMFEVAGVNWNSAADRATMYTPAVTMVAAWISAETGVGPSMASGSQTYSGNCADLPHAPTKS